MAAIKKQKGSPPLIFLRFFRWFCHPKLRTYIEGDLMELYNEHLKEFGKRKSDIKFIIDVLLLFRPGIIRPQEYHNLNHYGMYKSFFKIGWRNLSKNRGYSFINIGGLTIGMAVAIVIALWVWDELSYNSNHPNRHRVAAVLQNMTYQGKVETSDSESMQLGPELRANYASNFKHVVMSSFPTSRILFYQNKAITKAGYFMEAAAPDLLRIQMLKGSPSGLQHPNSILLSESVANALFGSEDPAGAVLKLDDQYDVKVTGVYKDLPDNASFNDLGFIAPLDLLVKSGNRNLSWVNNWLMVLVELAENVDMDKASVAIKEAKLRNVGPELANFKPELFLHPMSSWRLHSDFENGVNTGGRIELVRLFAIIGIFVLLLACINFMNLSTARSEKRAKEVGIRKVVGSVRSQLVGQFFSESFLIVFMAFIFAIILVQLTLPWFNEVAGKNLGIAWANPWLWLSGFGVIAITGLISGSYPAFYLSAFSAGKILKGTFHAGRYAAVPRKVLVVVQFVVSIMLVIGTVIVYQQIQFVKNRPVGYDRNDLMTIPIKTEQVKTNFGALRNELLSRGVVAEASMSECEVTDMWWSDYGFRWEGKDPDMQDNLYRGAVDYEFGKTVGWTIKEGRDFSREFASDSAAMILNEAMVDYMGFDEPIGQTVRAYGIDYTVIGVVENMISQSLYSPVKQTYYVIDRFNRSQFITVRFNGKLSTAETLQEIEKTFRKYNPGTPFEYQFVDDQFAYKFANESRVGKLAGFFAMLAVIISCLGLFGLASYMAERRTKEIGIRKVVGASIFSLWKLLTGDFIKLVAISCLIALPAAYYFMDGWLQQYEYRTGIAWWILTASGTGTLLITLATVSFQSIRTALANPVNSLRSV